MVLPTASHQADIKNLVSNIQPQKLALY